VCEREREREREREKGLAHNMKTFVVKIGQASRKEHPSDVNARSNLTQNQNF